uniref:Uncharacterized protein n=2 Tax=Magallana gigas TaxID=29159 RepID=K1QUQ1_MAGGI
MLNRMARVFEFTTNEQRMHMDKKWVRAVWREDEKEMELAIPSVWVEGNRIRWPNTSNAKSALKECKKPADKWLSFDLIKIKFSSDDYRECEDYDETTAVESECDSEPVMKRKPKKKVMSDFIMDSAEDNSSIKMQKKLPVAGFQRRVLYLLVEIRDLLKSPVTTASNTEDVDLVTIDSEEGFEALDRRLENRDFKASFKFLLQKIGGTDGTDHMKKAMLRTMTNSYMAGLNMKGKRGKKAFGSSQLYLLIKETVLTSHTQYTESKFNEDLAKFLKYAPERVGGGGRRRRDRLFFTFT